MASAPGSKFDLRLTRPNLIALTGICILALLGLAVAVAGTSSRQWFADQPQIDRAKVRAASEKIDPNTASAASLRRLPGIGPNRAQKIVQFRQSGPPIAYRTAADLSKIPGIGKGTVRKIAPYLNLPPD